MENIFAILGASGYEESIRTYIEKQIDIKDGTTVYTDRIGNLICVKHGKNPRKRIMVMSHMDEVGFQVMRINDDGSAVLKTLGNIKAWNAVNEIVTTVDGMKKGVLICNDPEGVRAHDIDKIKAVCISGQFQIGDVLGFQSSIFDGDSIMVGKAIDNRISCLNMLKVIDEIKTRDDIYFVFSVQEETGMRGARVAITTLEPDVVINLDVSPVGEMNSLKLGGGAGIKISDAIEISDQKLVERCEYIAEKNAITYQREVSNCGTTELIITNEKDNGAGHLGISVPCQNMHTSKTIVYKKDAEAAFRLLKLFLEDIGESVS
ncbi:MAG: hypothetical protein KHY39_09575 [Clostridiaceae bacterium]|jgi:putative aminopeptidase FrvX|nr:hypothetical protein [Clostridiaceae bacterium]